MDIHALLNRKVELLEVVADEERELEGYEEEELEQLLELESELGMSLEAADQAGIYFIDEDCFEDYARELAYDIGAINNDLEWPCTHIDWEAAARDLRMDYTEVEFDGNNYLVRI